MELLRVAGATLNQTPLDFVGNRHRIAALLAEARARGVELLCLPELALSGYGCEDAFFSLSTAKQAEEGLALLLPATAGLTVVIGLPHFYYGGMYNCAAVVQDGKILGLNAKRVLPREGVHYEPRWFRPWPFGKAVETTLCGTRIPFGDIRYRLGPLGIAIELCEEAWDSVPASAAHADAVDVILNPSASHFALGKYQTREHLVANSSRSMQVLYVYTNLVGNEAGRLIYDGGVLFAQGGQIVKRGPRFGFKDGELTLLDVNPELAGLSKLKVKPVREQPTADRGTGLLPLEQAEIEGRDPRIVAATAKDRVVVSKAPLRNGAVADEAKALSREEELLHAEMLGLFDYMRKTRSRGYVVSLSGGSDSACCALLVAHMLAASWQALGPGPLMQRLGLDGAVPRDERELIERCLTCVYQATANSGPVTKAAATELAQALGARFHAVEVQPIVDAYLKEASTLLGRPLTWATDDIALQNAQARVRAPLVWLLANSLQQILVTTSNRSEAAVGYATMDGDMAGGLAPIAGIDKSYLRRWLVWAETSCTAGLGPVPALRSVNVQAPTAELRPIDASGHAQTDEADLMPYDVLERIERYLVRDRLGPDDILQTLAFDFPSVESTTLRAYLEKFFRLWAQSQWKRERMAPSFHLDDLSLDPKSWCRFPILSVPYRLR